VPSNDLLLLLGGATLLAYAGFVAAMLLAGRNAEARALTGFIPDCLVLLRRLLGDRRIPRRRKFVLLGLVGYLSMPWTSSPTSCPWSGSLTM
jgi:hypothetical protein